MNSKSAKTSIGCFVFLAVIVAAFIYAPWQVAVGLMIVIFFISALIEAIRREFKRINKRKITNKSTIMGASEGFTELVAKIKNYDQDQKTWLTQDKVSYRSVSFNCYVRVRHGEGNWVSFHTYEPEDKKLLVTDGSGDCWISLHRAEIQVKEKSKRFNSKKLRDLLEENPIPDFPFEELEKQDTVLVREKWVEPESYVNFYGHFSKLPTYEVPKHIIEHSTNPKLKSWEKERSLTEADWHEMVKVTEDNGKGELNLLTSTYSEEPIDPLIMSLKGDARLNLLSYLNIAAMMMAIVLLIVIPFIILIKVFPEFLELGALVDSVLSDI